MTPWYLRLFYIPILNFAVAGLLRFAMKPKRMGGPDAGKFFTVGYLWFTVAYLVVFFGICVPMWFVPFEIGLAFWIGLGVIIFGQLVNSFAYTAMREHPEKKKDLVDWGIYRMSRHSHVLHGVIVHLGVIIMGWNLRSPIYLILWVYFILFLIMTHFWILSEEKINTKRFGKFYEDYMKKVPRYFLIRR